ncbi:MAG: ATP-dependent sacrificial sulfur transferase LarE [Nitrosopumilaceae archaeon]|uniref:ATP-dependent sacrificial sulfur transferase LarE n=3 Tax=Candidatus Nitrosomaritimum aestuariumsis TaxID=3342354 RepID=A0AC60W1L0_9ARCH|nr:ATP-dependent sacrificial sulfur transferase LarE [Nitrosopumilaceae archaeon]MBA4453532.1 ATP-dependent sacrificial sulfur transferase LarE [Nitrosopumilaceae archaeon]MBA4460545.1 ATP-dependent sacrificial sulfur transferase LarE [Nitrosopumilaceae archaeon]MBA4461378.1 ATP-dependent sacrificial sulfur transferase LarE [Nitrosopumilaceae archaeon]MBA4462788.1 ATP-dependent sacrificial sulfur transferase LarE [Nitrosopumilaceae archaeon]
MAKLDDLVNWFENKNTVLIALSGGVDSALVAYAAFQKLGSSAIAVTADYKTLSQEELDTSKQICKEIGISQILLDYNELENENFVKNDSNRCFYCRQELGNHLVNLAGEKKIDFIVDGTNVDDLGDYRPGIAALKQNGIRSPLVEKNFTKSEIRTIAKSVGLSVFDKPSNSCLASRIPWGQQITSERLARIEYGEKMVKQTTKLQQVRVRDIQGVAKIEVNKEDISKLHSPGILDEITHKLKLIGFSEVIIDSEGYKPGKINVIAD